MLRAAGGAVANLGGMRVQLDRVMRLLRRRGSTAQDAEDLVQEAVLRLHTYMRNGGTVQDADRFVTRVAINLSIDAHRHAHSSLYVEEPVETLELIDLNPTPDEVFAREERLILMKRSLDRVSVRTREVFFMHRLQGFSHAEIAARLSISKSAVEKHVASAVTTLAMARECAAPEPTSQRPNRVNAQRPESSSRRPKDLQAPFGLRPENRT